MKWVAVDLGSSTIKASILDRNNKPIRLIYSEGGFETTLLSSQAVVTDEGKALVGDYATLLGLQDPAKKVPDWSSSSCRDVILRSLFATVRRACALHYPDQDFGLVLLCNEEMYREAKAETSILKKIIAETPLLKEEIEAAATSFKEVRPVKIGDVLRRIITPQLKDQGLMLVADFGEKAFRITLLDAGKTISYMQHLHLGFSQIDMLSLIDCHWEEIPNHVELSLLGQVMQRIKTSLNNGIPVILPDSVRSRGELLAEDFDRMMNKFLYRCFETCSDSLRNLSKAWSDVTHVAFIGGGANCHVLHDAFNRYMQGQGYPAKQIFLPEGFDPQYGIGHGVLRLPELRDAIVINF